MAGVVGVSEGKGIGLSARTLDDTAFGQPRSRAWTGGGACVPRQAGPGHGLQDPRPGGRQAAQSALLPGTPRSRLCGKDGRSVVRLSQGQTFEEGRGRIAQEAKRCSGCHLLRREAGYSGHRNDGTPDLPPVPGVHATFAREHEYKRHGTVTLMAGINLLTGKVHALVKDRHRSREFIEFLKLLDTAYPPHTAIHLILDNHSAHISKETRAWLADQP